MVVKWCGSVLICERLQISYLIGTVIICALLLLSDFGLAGFAGDLLGIAIYFKDNDIKQLAVLSTVRGCKEKKVFKWMSTIRMNENCNHF